MGRSAHGHGRGFVVPVAFRHGVSLIGSPAACARNHGKKSQKSAHAHDRPIKVNVAICIGTAWRLAHPCTPRKKIDYNTATHQSALQFLMTLRNPFLEWLYV